MSLIIDLKEASYYHVQEVGGKALQLGYLHRLGLPVPGGLVLSALKLREISIETLRQQLYQTLQQRGWLDQSLAVRSSASQEDSSHASFAGIYHSCLNVVGIDAVMAAIAEVRQSLCTPQALAYCQHHSIAENHMAVILMPMVPAVCAGVAFSIDPQSGRQDTIVINAVAGLADKLVQGTESGCLIKVVQECDMPKPCVQFVSDNQDSGLSVLQVQTLADLIVDAAVALNYADPSYDFEWVYDGSQFYLVQARPITTKPWYTYVELAGQEAIWSNGNTRDVVPNIMGPMDWLIWKNRVDRMLEQGYFLAGYPLLPGVQRAALVFGRLYLNAALIQFEGYDALGIPPNSINALMGGHHPEIAVPPTSIVHRWQRGIRLIRYLIRSRKTRQHGRKQASYAIQKASIWLNEPLLSYSEVELLSRFEALMQTTNQQAGMFFLQGSGAGNVYLLLTLVERYLPGQSHALVAAMMADGAPSVTAQQSYDLMYLTELAKQDPIIVQFLKQGKPWNLEDLPSQHPFVISFQLFIAQYGQRGIYESYLTSPRYHEDSSYLFEIIESYIGNAQNQIRETQRQAGVEVAWQKLLRVLPWYKRAYFMRLLKGAQIELSDRELARSAFSVYSARARRLLLELGGRLVQQNILLTVEQVFDLSPQELRLAVTQKISPQALQARSDYRQMQQTQWKEQSIHEVIIGERALAARTPVLSPEGAWLGVAVGHGVAVGRARIILHPSEGYQLQPGEILLAPSTDPAWTPLFLRASGLVMETGGYLSHGAIVAREFGIPAVVNLPGILQKIKNGQKIQVDGTQGSITILEE